MSVQPVVQREVRVASRRRETWWMRVAFAGGTLGAFLLGMAWPDTRPADLGKVVLICLSVCGFTLSVFAGAYLTADAISRERRDGTLGLLFLTPLSGWQVVTGKMVTHTFQVGYAWVAAFPVFFLPVLLGGVTASEVVRVLFVLWVTLLLSVACGLFWSVVCLEASKAVLATIVSMLMLVFLPWSGVFAEEILSENFPDLGLYVQSPMAALVFSFHGNFNRGSPSLAGWNPLGSEVFWTSSVLQLVLAAILLVVTCLILPRVWRRTSTARPARPGRSGRGPVTRASEWYPDWLPPVEHSPLVWFFGRTLQARTGLRLLNLLLWGLFVIMLALSATDAAEEAFVTAICLAYARHLILRVEFAFANTRQLQEDRGSGALELLLTTAVDEGQVAKAHYQALRRAQRPALASAVAMNTLLELWIFLLYEHLYMDEAWFFFTVWFVGGALITLSDARTMRWLALRQAGYPRSQLKAAGVILATLQLPAWILFATTFVIILDTGDEGFIGLMFTVWAVACLGYNGVLEWRCRTWLRTYFRRDLAGDRSG